jgi:hypothetical protein
MNAEYQADDFFLGFSVQKTINMVTAYDFSEHMLPQLRKIAEEKGSMREVVTVVVAEYKKEVCERCPLSTECSGVMVPRQRVATVRAFFKPKNGDAAERIKEGLCHKG